MIILFPKVIPIGRVAEISMAELPKPTNKKSQKSMFSKIRSRGRSTLGIGAKHI